MNDEVADGGSRNRRRSGRDYKENGSEAHSVSGRVLVMSTEAAT